MIAAQAPVRSAASLQQKYRGHVIAVYEDGEGGFGFSIFDASAPKGAKVQSLISRKAFPSADAARNAAVQAVDMAGVAGLGALGGFNFGKIGKMFDRAGQGVAANAGVIGVVGGAVLTATGVGAPAGMALAAAGGAVQAASDQKKAKKEADAQRAEAEKQAADATAAAAAVEAETAASVSSAGPSAAGAAAGRSLAAAKAKPIWPWIAAGGGAFLVLGGIGLWLILRKKD
jgi:hypothetical protein